MMRTVAELQLFTGTMDSGKSTLALQTNHNHAARGRVGRIFTSHDRAGEATLSSRLGLSVEAVEVTDDFHFWRYVVDELTSGSRIDYLVPANAIGGPRVFPHFMSALLTGGPLRLVDGGRVRRAFLHIADANRAFQTVLEHPQETRNQIYNVGNPENDLTIREIARLMLELYEELTGRAAASAVVDISGEEFYGPGYEDSSRLPPEVSKLRRLGWAPQHDIRATFRDAMEFYLDQSCAQLDYLHLHSTPGASVKLAANLDSGSASA